MREAATTHPQFVLADFAEPTLATFLQAHLDDLVQTSPPESCHALDLTELQGEGVRLFVAHDGAKVIATGAIAPVESGHEELKSMRTDPALRGQGLGRALLRHLVEDARARGVRRVSLETGPTPSSRPPARSTSAKGSSSAARSVTTCSTPSTASS